jgi:D-glycerate 3-kinase
LSDQAMYKARMQEIKSLIAQYVNKEALPAAYNDLALKWYTPLCKSLSLHHDKAKHGTMFIGINGCQGSGKSTLSGLLSYLLTTYFKKSSIVISLDDFYLTRTQRLNLASKVHPLLETRGVPGTHDTELMQKVLEALKLGQSIQIPTFNKAIDDRNEIYDWQAVNGPIDIIIVEGWCWGTMPQNEGDLAPDVNDLEKNHDTDRAWRSYVNKQLAINYVPLYSFIHKWVFLRAPSFEHVYKWRCEQEHKLKSSAKDTSNVMSDEEVLTFIQYYQRLTMHTLCTLDARSDWVFELDNDRGIITSSQNEQ